MSDPGEEEVEAPPPPRVIQEAEIHRQYQLPVKAEKFSFGLAFTPPDGSSLDIDLSCVLFNKEGAVMDCAYYYKYSALEGSVRHNGDNRAGASEGDSEVIHVYPGLIPEDCCLMMFTVSGDGLGTCSAMELTAYAKEAKREKTTPHAAIPRVLCTCHQLTVHEFLSKYHAYLSQPPTHLKGMLDMQEAIVKGKLLSGQPVGDASCQVALAVYRSANGWIAYYTMEAAPAESRDWGSAVPTMKAIASKIPSLEAASKFVADAAEAIVLPPKAADRSLTEAMAFDPLKAPEAPTVVESWPAQASAAAPAPPPTRLRLDVGWALWSAEPEGVDMQFQVVFSGANGEVVECGEEQGVTQGIRGPPEEEEAEAEEEEGGAPKEDEIYPVPKGQDTDPHGFPVKESFYIVLHQLPAKVRNITVQVTNMAGAGMKETKSLHVRAVDATDENPVKHKDLFVYCVANKRGENANRTVAVLAKLYKEYAGSAFTQLRSGGCQPLASYINDADKVREVLRAVRDEYCGHLDLEKAIAAAIEAEENGEENVIKPAPAACAWRIQGLGLLEKADDLDAYAEEAKRSASYEGTYNAMGRRECDNAKVVYENGDLYIGQYVDDRRNGKGMYIFANKGAYAGDYENGMRNGHGVMTMPDGGCYTGAFQNDKFHGEGQYEYPDKSCYIGSWAANKKHGHGTYWDKHGGCVSGTWEKGILTGQSMYHQPAYTLDASYTKGIPEGECTFTCAAFRKNKEREIACAYITTEAGPVLTHAGTYSIPAGAAADPKLDDEGNPIEDDSKPKMPCFPKYEGLGFVGSHASASPGPAMVYPPPNCTPPACVKVPVFTMAEGLMPAAT